MIAPQSRISQLGYLVFEVSNLAAWETFAVDVLGLLLEERRTDGSLVFRNDSHFGRLFIVPGGADDLVGLGWETPNEAALKEAVGRIRLAGHEVIEGDDALRSARHVARVFQVEAPGGIPTELYCGPAIAATPFRSRVVASGFVAEELGLGHLVVNSPDNEATARFYEEVLGFQLSDRIECEFKGMRIELTFMHINGRHHTLAFGGAQRKRLHHFMLEVNSIDDVGLAQDRVARSRVASLAQTLGKHPNDRMVSFYAETPSGFQVEFGSGGRTISEGWTVSTHHLVSEWGHWPPSKLARPKITPPA